MDFDDGAVHPHGFKLDTHDLLALQVFEHTVQHAVFGPAVHARVNGMPVAESLRQSSPITAMFGDIQNGVEYLPVRNAYIAALDWEVWRNTFVLRLSEFHPCRIARIHPLVLTVPNRIHSLIPRARQYVACTTTPVFSFISDCDTPSPDSPIQDALSKLAIFRPTKPIL